MSRIDSTPNVGPPRTPCQATSIDYRTHPSNLPRQTARSAGYTGNERPGGNLAARHPDVEKNVADANSGRPQQATVRPRLRIHHRQPRTAATDDRTRSRVLTPTRTAPPKDTGLPHWPSRQMAAYLSRMKVWRSPPLSGQTLTRARPQASPHCFESIRHASPGAATEKKALQYWTRLIARKRGPLRRLNIETHVSSGHPWRIHHRGQVLAPIGRGVRQP